MKVRGLGYHHCVCREFYRYLRFLEWRRLQLIHPETKKHKELRKYSAKTIAEVAGMFDL